jgi:ABC-type polysaccharide/polyol phosphate transport system, ATPase component
MIRLNDVNKLYPVRGGSVHVLRDVNLTVNAGERVGILGRNGAGKSTLIRLLSGAELPTSGSVDRNMSVSWPLAFGGAFQGSLTGLDNLRFICRIYGVEPEDNIAFVEEFSELGLYLREPVKSYSSGMRARLAFAISMVIEFDCFLIDEIIAVGDARFHEKCNNELFIKRGERAMVIVSHDARYIREHCSRAAVLKDGRLYNADTLDEAFEFYHSESALAA